MRKKYSHVLAATELTPHSIITVATANEIAKAYGARLSLVHVVEPMPVSWIVHSEQKDNAEDLLHRVFGGEITPDDEEAIIAQELRNIGNKFNVSKEDLHICMGIPKVEIIRLAEKQHIDLIVVGSHGHRGISKLLGSTAAAILHSAGCDVLTVSYHKHVKELDTSEAVGEVNTKVAG